MDRFTGILGILAVLLAAWLGSTDRKHIRWRTVAWGLALQVIFAFFVLRFTYGQEAMSWAGGVINSMLASTAAGTKVLFGALGTPNSSLGSIFAFQVLPTIIFISAFFAVLYHVGVMQIIIRGFAWVMLKTMRISGAESLNVAASVFMGQTEAPLTIRPFLSKATRSELMTINSLRVALERNGRMVSGASVWPMKMLAATFMLSAPEIRIVLSMTQAMARMMICIRPMW